MYEASVAEIHESQQPHPPHKKNTILWEGKVKGDAGGGELVFDQKQE